MRHQEIFLSNPGVRVAVFAPRSYASHLSVTVICSCVIGCIVPLPFIVQLNRSIVAAVIRTPPRWLPAAHLPVARANTLQSWLGLFFGATWRLKSWRARCGGRCSTRGRCAPCRPLIAKKNKLYVVNSRANWYYRQLSWCRARMIQICNHVDTMLGH